MLTPEARIRSSRALIFGLHDDGLWARHCVTGTEFMCSSAALDVLTHLRHWVEVDRVFELFSGYQEASVASAITSLAQVDAIVVEGSDLAALEADFETNWKWGPVAAAFHYGCHDVPFLSPEDAVRVMVQKAALDESPALLPDTRQGSMLPLPTATPDSWMRPMLERRTCRRFSGSHLSLSELAELLHAGFAVTGFVDVDGVGRLPLTTSPSGGARNPYDCYLLVREGHALEAGAYLYSGLDHALLRVGDGQLPPFSYLVADQMWADQASVMLVLVARLERTMWKYENPAAYRVLLIEAGHIAQNIALRATRLGLAAATTCALRTSVLHELLAIEKSVHAAIYTILAGHKQDPT